MIDKTKAIARTLADSLKKAIEEYLLFEITPLNVDDERKTLKEIIRNPNVSFSSINQMKNEQNMKVSAIQTNLASMFDVRAVLKSNRFKSLLTFNFGILEIKENSSFLSNTFK